MPALPPPLPRAGLFCVDLEHSAPYWRWFGVRFYPEPSETLAVVAPSSIRCVGNYEAAIRFLPGLSYPPDEWESVFANQDDDLRDAWSDCESEIDNTLGGRAGARSGDLHLLGGHRTLRLDELNLRPPDGYPKDPSEYEMLLRLPYDNAAGFAWGSNVAYVFIHRDDLAAGRLERAFDAPANY